MKERSKQGMVGFIVIALIAVAIFFLVKPNNNQVEPEAPPISQEKDIAKEEATTIEYKVDSKEDVSYADVKRKTFRVIIDPNATDEQLIEVFKEIDEEKYDNVTVWFYKDKSEVNDVYTVAMLERDKKNGEIKITK